MSNALVDEHYGVRPLVAAVREALEFTDLGSGVIPWDALAPLDQFHVGGAAATKDLVQRLDLKAGVNVIDVGCGLGGPARMMAALHGCDVVGIDINPAFIELATYLTERSMLAGKARFLVADAVEVPFAGGSFECAISQHVAMNIADRAGLYREIHRLLVPGGRFGLFDVVVGSGEPIHFPVPWARDPAASFVISAEDTRSELEQAGFEVVEWRDATPDGMGWQQAQAAANQSRPEALRRLGLPLVMGPHFMDMAANLGRNFQEGRLRLLQAIVRRAR